MNDSLTARYRRWFDYEKDSHRKTLDSLKAVSEEQRESEHFRQAVYLMGHLGLRFKLTSLIPMLLLEHEVVSDHA